VGAENGSAGHGGDGEDDGQAGQTSSPHGHRREPFHAQTLPGRAGREGPRDRRLRPSLGGFDVRSSNSCRPRGEPSCRFPRLTTMSTIQARTPVVAAVLAGSILLTSCAGLRDGGAAAPGPDTPISSTPDPSAPTGKPTPLLVEPRPGLVDIRPQPWDKARVIDPRTVEVRFYSGIEECYGVARVDVDYRERSVVITVYGGRVPTAEVCIEIAVLKAVRVDLTEPLAGRRVVDGAEQAA
jgi:hypothetical protein